MQVCTWGTREAEQTGPRRNLFVLSASGPYRVEGKSRLFPAIRVAVKKQAEARRDWRTQGRLENFGKNRPAEEENREATHLSGSGVRLTGGRPTGSAGVGDRDGW